MNKNIFSQKHYVAIAELLGKVQANELTIEDIIDDFSRMFTKDYPYTGTIFYFDSVRFKEAIKKTCEAEKAFNALQLENFKEKIASIRSQA